MGSNYLASLTTYLQKEYLGDWVNLMGHQKAAFEILTTLFTPETIMQTPTGRMILAWYARFDVFVAIMGGFRTALPREWFTTFVEFCQKQQSTHSDSLKWKLEGASGALRLISMEMSLLFASGNRGEISPQDFAFEHQRLTESLLAWSKNLDPAITDPKYLVTDFSYKRPLEKQTS
jgi:hypothetical protein